MPLPSLPNSPSPYETVSFESRGVRAVFSPLEVSTSHKYASLIDNSSFSRICLSSGDQSRGSHPPPCNFISRRSDFGSLGFITERPVCVPVRLVDIYASSSPFHDHGPIRSLAFPSVNSVTPAVFRESRYE